MGQYNENDELVEVQTSANLEESKEFNDHSLISGFDGGESVNIQIKE